MRTAEEIVQYLQEVIANTYLHPAMYGQSAYDVEHSLWIDHTTWAYATERERDYWPALADSATAADCGANMFSLSYREQHPTASEHEVLKFTLKHWAQVTERLGIPLPLEYPDPRHSFLPTDKQPPET